MTYPTDRLSSLYYFLTEKAKGVVYEISSSQDADGCGYNPIIKSPIRQTLTVDAWKKVQDKSLYEIVKSNYMDGDVEKIDVLSYEEAAKVFPHIKVQYTYDVISMGNTTTATVTKYYWLQNIIKDGDSFNGTKFIPMKHDTSEATYIGQYMEQLNAEMARLAVNGASIEGISSTFPFYFVNEGFSADSGTTMVIDRRTAKSLTITPSDSGVSVYALARYNDAIKEYAKEQALKTANGIVSKIGIEYTGITLTEAA